MKAMVINLSHRTTTLGNYTGDYILIAEPSLSPLPSCAVVSRPWTSAQGGRRGLHPPSCRGSLASSCREALIGQPFARSGVNEARQALKGMPLDVSLVQPESEFVNVGGQQTGTGRIYRLEPSSSSQK